MVSNAVSPADQNSEQEVQNWRRKCGCLKTSDKLKKILKTFPPPPPPTPLPLHAVNVSERKFETAKGNGGCTTDSCFYARSTPAACCDEKKSGAQPWMIVSEVVQLVQLSVTATALAIYYLIYCYMQLVYYTLRSAIYFHNADGPMKITIGVVTLTSLVVGFNIIVRVERLIGHLY